MIVHSKPMITTKDREAVTKVLVSGMLANGALVNRFEESCARYLCTTDAVAVSSGTAALTLALLALNLKPLSEIILPTYVCKNVAEAVLFAGYKPVFCDIGDYWNMTPDAVENMISKHTGAIILVHIFGIPLHVQDFLKFGIPIIEDACQAFGVKDETRFVGNIGTIGCFSFHATKCLTTAEGGLLVCEDNTLLHRIRELRDGQSSLGPRFAAQLNDMQAALGLSQLESYAEFVDRRKAIADRYFEELGVLPIQLPHAIRSKSLFFRFPVRFDGVFISIQQAFAAKGIHIRRGVDSLLHRLLNLPDDTFPKATSTFEETISLPIYPALTDDEQTIIIQGCKEIWR
jgi:UDP-4-amino-4-deoxy-L-arabinose-oxoglutarate aminotransferase